MGSFRTMFAFICKQTNKIERRNPVRDTQSKSNLYGVNGGQRQTGLR